MAEGDLAGVQGGTEEDGQEQDGSGSDAVHRDLRMQAVD
jgi:hypothetical protein